MRETTLETEVKIPCMSNLLDDYPELKRELITERHFEDNWLLDFDDGRLRRSGAALRLRIVGHQGTMTFKGTPIEHPHFKVRQEIEAETSKPEEMLTILECLGLRRVFRYQKFRAVYRLTLPSGQALQAMFDETPIGNFLELEGGEDAIEELLDHLRLDHGRLIRVSYPALHAAHCRASGKRLSDMVFG